MLEEREDSWVTLRLLWVTQGNRVYEAAGNQKRLNKTEQI